MDRKLVNVGGSVVAVVTSDAPILTDTQSALDLLAMLGYNDNCRRIALYKESIADDFFRLSSGVAGEILQKFVTYDTRLAIIGDFSAYESKPLHDFVYECNKGRHIFFVPDEQTAVDRLASV